MTTKPDAKHALPPAVCVHCLQGLFDAIPGDPDRILFLHCAHNGPGTLCRIQLTAGVISSWRLSAPIDKPEAERQVADHAQHLEAHGLTPPPRGRTN